MTLREAAARMVHFASATAMRGHKTPEHEQLRPWVMLFRSSLPLPVARKFHCNVQFERREIGDQYSQGTAWTERTVRLDDGRIFLTGCRYVSDGMTGSSRYDYVELTQETATPDQLTTWAEILDRPHGQTGGPYMALGE